MKQVKNPRNKRAEQAEETRERIFKAARRLFGKKGYEKTGMDDIAEAAGVSVGTCYHHFGSKYRIFQEVYQRSDQYFRQEVPALLTAPDWRGKVVEFFRTCYGGLIVSDGIELSRHLFVPTNDLFLREDSGMLDTLSEIISQGQSAGEISLQKDARSLADFLFVIARGVVFDWCLHNGSYDVREKLGEHIEFVMKAHIKEQVTSNK